MASRARKCLIATVFLVAGACASAPPDQVTSVGQQKERVATDVNETVDLFHDAVVHDTEFAAERTAVWNAVLNAHEQLGIPLTRADATSGTLVYTSANLVQTIAGKRASHYVDCGNGAAGQPRAESYRLNVVIGEKIDSVGVKQTQLRTMVQATARSSATSGDAIHCNTTGELEKLIAAMTSTRLN